MSLEFFVTCHTSGLVPLAGIPHYEDSSQASIIQIQQVFACFVRMSCQAFNILREYGNLLLNLFMQMVPAGMPELQSADDVAYLQGQLNLNLTEHARTSFDNAPDHEGFEAWRKAMKMVNVRSEVRRMELISKIQRPEAARLLQ